ncbi:hypothetical protein AQUSIP_07950 [Aquicella siphonis]|uniref:PI3K/PI4K catalytic domain-containing protein n=1 Tax=Aquicella siphonis TaxID=254247 RepID=A0A5E4PFU5_9COXI|nr:hypothetical protein [Aquicella siphonis]VVC75505.1 hypothetical protein AQUSIP_07950 [Aquicella siphonis]
MRRNNTKDTKKKQHVENTRITPISVDDFRPTEGSLHRVTTYKKEGKPSGSSHAWVVKHLKPTSESPTLFQIEGTAGDFYRLLIGPREPKGRPIMSESKPVGLMSRLVEGYTPVSENNINLSNKKHVRQLAEISVVAAFLEEGDLHEDNLGFNSKGELIKIDHGQSLWSIAKEYHKGGQGTVTDFSLTAEDIRNLPFVRKGHSAKICPLDEEEMKEIALDPVFIETKFKTLLKIALMPDEVCHSICDAFIDDNSLKNEIATHLISRRDELCDTLMTMPEFKLYLIEHPRVIDEIKHEYGQFNVEFRKGKHSHRRVDIDAVEARFQVMVENVKTESLYSTLMTKVQERLDALSSETSTLAGIKRELFTDLKSRLLDAHSDEQVIDVFDNWIAQSYHAQGKKDVKYDGMTCEDIMSTRRKWDPRVTKSSIFITETKTLLENKRTNLLDLISYDDEYNSSNRKTF